ncbi:MAG: uroporphyrinogen decarboxylase [Cyanobacteria bacterium HKST-UBA04]|nr:uroporphyrinogen decarboxylase [Cyanobacteria bacterium HKST-UBA04]
MDPNTASPRLVKACRGETLDRPPVWFMRQAGRYLPEYQDIRQKTTFLGLCKTPADAIEVSLQPWRRFGVDAVIMFCDILIPPEAMGMSLHFGEGGPQFHEPLAHVDDLARLKQPDIETDMGFVFEILRGLRTELSAHPDTALIGFCGAPWTLASYMIEGGTSKHHLLIHQWLYNQPQALHRLMDMLTDCLIDYMLAQIEAGAQVLQVFDTWAGTLSREQYKTFVLPYHQRLLAALPKETVPVILYVKNSGHVLDLMGQAEPSVISLDGQYTLDEARRLIGRPIPIQGNLDNTLFFAQPDVIAREAQAMVEMGGTQGYIFNVNHGLLPQTPPEHVQLVVDTVKATTKVTTKTLALT